MATSVAPTKLKTHDSVSIEMGSRTANQQDHDYDSNSTIERPQNQQDTMQADGSQVINAGEEVATDEDAQNHGQSQTTQSNMTVSKVKGVTIEDAIRHTGGFGRYQIKAVLMFQCSITCGSLALYPTSFFELQPDYLCQTVGSSEWESCKPEEFCGNEESIEYQIDFSKETSLKNWISEYGLECAPKYELGLFGSLYFAAVVLGSLVFAPLADRIGRRPVTLAGVLLAAISQTCILFSPSLKLTYALYFLTGLTMPMRVFVGYIYAMEFLPLGKTQMATALTMGVDGLGIALSAFWFLYISQDWKTFFLMSTVFCYLTFILIICTMSESPKYLVSRGRYDEARKVMQRIFSYNKVKGGFQFMESESALAAQCTDTKTYQCRWEEEVAKQAQGLQRARSIDVKIEPVYTQEDDINELQFDTKSLDKMDNDSFRHFLTSKSMNLVNLLIFVFLFCAASFNYYLLNFYLKYMPGSIYMNSIVSSLSESVAHWMAGCIVVKLGSVNGLTGANALATLSAVALWASTASDWTDPVPFTVLAAKFGTGAAFAMLYMSTLQYFPNRYMGRVFGTCNVTARFVTIMAPMVAELPSPIPELIMIVSCLLAAILTRFLRKPASMNKADTAKAEQAIQNRMKKQSAMAATVTGGNEEEQQYSARQTQRLDQSVESGSGSHRQVKLELDFGDGDEP